MKDSRTVKAELKKAFPANDGWKFSVSGKSYYETVSIIQAPVNFDTEYEQVNEYNLDWYNYPYILQGIIGIIGSGYSIHIGKYDKPFQFIENEKGAEYIRHYIAIEQEKQMIADIEYKAKEQAQQEEWNQYKKEMGPQTNVESVDLSNIQVIEVNPFRINAVFPSTNKLAWLPEYEKQIENGSFDSGLAEVHAVAALTPKQFEAFSFRLNECFEWVAPFGGSYSEADFGGREMAEFTNEDWDLYRETAITNVLKVMNIVTGEYILTDSQGHNYARYVGFEMEPATA